MDDYGLADDVLDDRYHDTATITEHADHIEKLLVRFFASLEGEEAYHGLQARSFVACISRAVEEIVRDQHWAGRGFFATVDHPDLGRQFIYPGAYAIFSETPWAISRRAPKLGEHNTEILDGLRTTTVAS